MKRQILSAVAIGLVVLVVAIVVSPFVDLPLTTTRNWEGLALTVLTLVWAIYGAVAPTGLLLFLRSRAWSSRPCQQRPHENQAGALILNVARLC